jgi:hypothetical protein
VWTTLRVTTDSRGNALESGGKALTRRLNEHLVVTLKWLDQKFVELRRNP